MVSNVCKDDPDGRPLAVCLNDCEIDSGQPDPQLRRVCFLVKCAFAEMRWGNDLMNEQRSPTCLATAFFC
jgi:hypothetical protein